MSNVNFATIRENFSDYELENGDQLRVKYVVTQIMKVEAEKNAGGTQKYNVSFIPVMTVINAK